MMRLLKSWVVPKPGIVAAGNDWKAGWAEMMDFEHQPVLCR